MQIFRLELSIERLPKMPNQLLGAHWRTRSTHSKQWMRLVAAYAKERPKEPLKKASLSFTRGSSSQPDFDGLAGSFKPIQDALVKLKILQDDTPDHISATYLWEKAPPKKGFVKITIEEIPT